MKHKTVKIIISSLVSLLVLAAVGFFQFTRQGYLCTISCRAAFVEIEENVYVTRDYAAAQEDEMHKLLADARARVEDFYGSREAKPVIVLSNDPKIIARLGEKETYTYTFPKLRSYICVSDEYCNIDIFAHELTHAELYCRLGGSPSRKLPRWFDEGLATQNDWREKYDLSQWDGSDAVALEDMDTAAEFYGGTQEERHVRYISAKREIAAWMETHHREGLLALIEKLKSGADFDTAYAG
jgi:hypothetical protein